MGHLWRYLGALTVGLSDAAIDAELDAYNAERRS